MEEEYSIRRLDGIEASYERYCYYRQKGGNYSSLLIPEGNTFTPLYFQSKQFFKPHGQAEKKRAREIDVMARYICFDSFSKWSLLRKVRLLVPYFFVAVRKIKNVRSRSDNSRS